MRSSRDDFSQATLRAAAGRVGYRCSFPGCKHVTIGPSMESNTKTSIIGVGAHICAAAAGGPRYDPSMSSSERKSISNCIWLCQSHAHLIDTDVAKYPVDLLQRWKNDAEEAASQALEGTEAYTSFYNISGNSITEFEQLFAYLIHEGQYRQLHSILQQLAAKQLAPKFMELVHRYIICYDVYCDHSRIQEDLTNYLPNKEDAGINDLARTFISFIMPNCFYAIKEYITNDQLLEISTHVFPEDRGQFLFSIDSIPNDEIHEDDVTLIKARLYHLYTINGLTHPDTICRFLPECKLDFFFQVLLSIGKIVSSTVYQQIPSNSPSHEEYLDFLYTSVDRISDLDLEYQAFFWKYVLGFYSGNIEQFDEIYNKCPETIKALSIIEKRRIEHALTVNYQEVNPDYLVRFAEDHKYYDLITRYVSMVDAQQASSFLDDHRFLLGRDVNILFFRLFILSDIPQEKRKALLKKYCSVFSSSFLYHCMVVYECEDEESVDSELLYLRNHPQYGMQEAAFYISVLHKHKKWGQLAELSCSLFPFEIQYSIARALLDSKQVLYLKAATEIFERLYKSGWVRRGLKKDYAYVQNQNGKTEAAKRLLREEYDENLDPTVLQELIHLRLYTNDYTDDEYFRALSSYCDSKSMFLAGEVSLRRKEYQQAYDFFLRSLLADESYKPSYFGIFNLSIQNKLPQIDANGRDKKIVVLENHSEARRIAIHAPNILRGITPTTFASCEHFSIENPAVSCLVFCKAQDTVVFENRQYTVKTIIPLQEEVVKTCYEVVLNDPNVIKIRGNTASEFINSISSIMAESNKAVSTILAEYNTAPLQMPLSFLAKAVGKSMLTTSEFLMHGNTGKIRNNQEYPDLTQNAVPSFVFSFDALVHIFELGIILPERTIRSIICPAQVRNRLDKDIDDNMRDMLSDNHPGNMVFQDGKLTILEYTDSIRQERYLQLSRFKEFVNSTSCPQESYDYNPVDDEIGAKVAEIILGEKMLCESGALGLAQSLNSAVIVTDDQMLYCAAQHSGIKSCGITGFLSVSGFTWDQLLDASKKLKKMNYANYLPFELYKAIVDAMLDEGEEGVDQKSAIIQEWIRFGGDGKPTEQHKDIILGLLRNTVQSEFAYLNPGFFLSELAAPIIEERNPGMLQQIWEKVRASLPEMLYDLLGQSIDYES